MRVRYYSHLGLETGFGRSALDMALAMARHGGIELDLRLIPSTSSIPERGHELRKCINAGGAPDAVIVHTLPRDCPRVLEIEGLQNHRATVAYTTWETDTMPDPLLTGMARFDQIWAPSRASCDAMDRPGDHPGRILAVPHTYDPDGELLGKARAAADHAGRPDYAFYYVGAWNRRKNVTGLIEAFAHAFGDAPPDDVTLVLHCPGVKQQQVMVAVNATGYDRLPIRLSNEQMPDQAIWGLHADADCFVTATRGEGWNLGAFEAHLVGRYLICPAGQGMADYLDDTTAATVGGQPAPAAHDVSLEMVGPGQVKATVTGPPGLTSGSTWIEPNLCDLAEEMRDAYEGRVSRLRYMTDYDPAARFGYEAVAKMIIANLENACG